MIRWKGQTLDELPRAELEAATREALALAMRLEGTGRPRLDSGAAIMGFLTGAMLAAGAIAFGLALA